MLAEPRRKIRYSIDPRNTNWANDDSKFGQKLLEKMGWSKGEGLGANKDGNPQCVAVAIKNDNKGVGWNKKSDDNWIAHQDDFNSLLSSLNNCHGVDNESADKPESKKVLNLEQTSRSSKGRVHYQKFTKGKDLSLKTETDLDCIFGKRKSKSKKEETTATPEPIQPAHEEAENGGLNIVTSSDSIQAYFAKKMAALKSKRGQFNLDNDSSEHIKQEAKNSYSEMNVKDNDMVWSGENTDKGIKRTYEDFEYSYPDNDEKSNNDAVEYDVVKGEKDKKKKKVRFSLGEDIVALNGDMVEENLNEHSDVLDLENKKKKKKSKKKKKDLKKDNEEVENNEDQDQIDSNTSFNPINENEIDMLIDSISYNETHIKTHVDKFEDAQQVKGIPSDLHETNRYLESINDKNPKRKKSKKGRKKEEDQELEPANNAYAINEQVNDTKYESKVKSGKKSKSLDQECDQEEMDIKFSVSTNVENICDDTAEISTRKNKKRKREKMDDDLEGNQEKMNIKIETETELITVDELVNPFPTRKAEKVLLEYANSNNLDVKFIMASTGPGHKPVHTMHVQLGERKFHSVQCGSKKEAKKMAATKALCILDREGELNQLRNQELKEKEEWESRKEEKKKENESKPNETVEKTLEEQEKQISKRKNKEKLCNGDSLEQANKRNGPGSNYFRGSCLDDVEGYPGFPVKPLTELTGKRKDKRKERKGKRMKQVVSSERKQLTRKQDISDVGKGGYRNQDFSKVGKDRFRKQDFSRERRGGNKRKQNFSTKCYGTKRKKY